MSGFRNLKNLQGEQPEDLGHTGFKRDDSFPKVLGDVIAQMELGGRRHFPFDSWRVQNRFDIPSGSGPFFRQCESAAEAFFIRPFTYLAGVTYKDLPPSSPGMPRQIVGVAGDLEMHLQVRCALSRIDVVVYCGDFKLAAEIDGLTYHRTSADKIAEDYIRERRIVVAGYTLVRFTASEVFMHADECWRQIELIVAAHVPTHKIPSHFTQK